MRLLYGMLWAGMLLGCRPDLADLDECTPGDQSCDCQGACDWDNQIHECIDGEWEPVVDCGQLLCQEGEPPECAG